MKPLYVAVPRGVTWSVREQDAAQNYYKEIIVNLTEWQARAVAAILNGG